MLSRTISQDVKNKVYEVTQEVFEEHGKVETEKVRVLMEEDHGICFFNTAELEKLIKEGLDKQIFAYVGTKSRTETKVCVMTPSKSQILILDRISINEKRTSADLIFKNSKVGELDLAACELKKLDRADGNMEYYELVEREE